MDADAPPLPDSAPAWLDEEASDDAEAFEAPPEGAVASVRTSNAIFSMIALMPMHVSGAYRARPLPLVARALRR